MAAAKTRARPAKRKAAPPKTRALTVRNPYAIAVSPDDARDVSFQTFRTDATRFTMDDQPFERLLKKYGHSSTWVYIAVNRIANAAAQIPIQVIKKDREGQPNALVKTHDGGLLALLERPNPWQSLYDFIETCMVSLALTGNLFIEQGGPRGSVRPAGLWVMNPARMEVVADPRKFVAGYRYHVNGEVIDFAANDIVHVKFANPMNEYYGLAPTTAAALPIELDIDSVQWNRTFLQKGGWPAGAIWTENDVEKDVAARLQRQISRTISAGKRRAGQVLLLTGGMKWQQIAVSPKDLDWLGARQMSRDEILAIYGVPFAIAGLFSTEQTTARSAGVEQQIKQFYRGTVCSWVQRLLDALNREVVPAFSTNFKLVPDLRSVPALSDDVQTDLTRAQIARTLIAAGFPINYILARYYPDFAPVSWGDEAWMNSSMLPVSMLLAGVGVKKPNGTGPNPTTLPTVPGPQAGDDPAEAEPAPKKDLDALRRARIRALTARLAARSVENLQDR